MRRSIDQIEDNPIAPFAAHWTLDPAVSYLNHGSFGACPATVLQAQTLLRQDLEREPIDFLDSTLHAPGAGLDAKGLHDWFRERGIETWMHTDPQPVMRISAQLHNHAQQFERLALLLRECLYGD